MFLKKILSLYVIYFGEKQGKNYLKPALYLNLFRKLVPKQTNDVAEFTSYISLSINRGFISYGTSTKKNFNHFYDDYDSIKMTIISFDLNDSTYELIGTSYEFFARSLQPNDIFYSSSRILMAKCIYQWPECKLHIFQHDNSLSTIFFQKSIDITISHRYFNLIDGKIVFASYVYGSPGLKSITLINEDNSFVEIEKTGAHHVSKFWLDHNLQVNFSIIWLY